MQGLSNQTHMPVAQARCSAPEPSPTPCPLHPPPPAARWVAFVKSRGVGAVVSLLSGDEVAQTYAAPGIEAQMRAAFGDHYHHLDLKGSATPADVIKTIDAEIKSGHKVGFRRVVLRAAADRWRESRRARALPCCLMPCVAAVCMPVAVFACSCSQMPATAAGPLPTPAQKVPPPKRAPHTQTLVHCWGGGGRTGLVQAAWLVHSKGLSAADAAAAVVAHAQKLGVPRRVDVAAVEDFLKAAAN